MATKDKVETVEVAVPVIKDGSLRNAPLIEDTETPELETVKVPVDDASAQKEVEAEKLVDDKDVK